MRQVKSNICKQVLQKDYVSHVTLVQFVESLATLTHVHSRELKAQVQSSEQTIST